MLRIVQGICYIWLMGITVCPKLSGHRAGVPLGCPGGGRSNSQKTTLKYLGVTLKELVRDNGWSFLSSDSP